MSATPPSSIRWSSALAVVAALSVAPSIGHAQPAAPPPPADAGEPDGADAEEPAAPAGPEVTPVGVSYRDATQAQKDAAREVHKAGRAAEEAGLMVQAVARYREAHGIVAHPKMRLKIVRVLRAMGRLGEAYDEARILIKEVDVAATQDDKLAATAVEARDELRALGEKVGFVRLASPPAPGSELRVNGRLVPASAWGEPIAVEPGPVELVAGAARASVTVATGQEASVSLQAVRAVEPPAETGSGYDGPNRLMMAIIAGGVGLVGVTMFGVLGTVSQGQFDRLEDGCDGNGYCDPALESVRDRGTATQIGANVSLAIGLVALAGGGALFTWEMLDPAKGKDDVAVVPRLVVGPSSVSIQGTF